MQTSPHQMLTVIGLMSGTSVDAIDAALVRTNGGSLVRTSHTLTGQYSPTTKQAILALAAQPQAVIAQRQDFSNLERQIAQDHAKVVNQLVAEANVKVDLLGFHGQTVYHNPQAAQTIQLGDAHLLAQLVGIDTVYDFRQCDMQAGGQGAPLAPIYHQQLIRETKLKLPAGILNIGGISNITAWDGEQLFGFDCGPGNCLMDDYMRQHFERPYDEGGLIAASGRVDTKLLKLLMSDDYFAQPAPKSLDRQYFHGVLAKLKTMQDQDALATLNAFTVEAVAVSIEQLPFALATLVCAGGGQHNDATMALLKSRLPCEVLSATQIGICGDFIEAELMAFLAARHYYDKPFTFPGTTGVAAPNCGGVRAISERA